MELDPLTAYADDPVGDTVHHPFSAYNQGHDAALAGFTAARCPYSADDERERQWWLTGHWEASLEENGVVEAQNETPDAWALVA